ncbi:MAG: FAD/NAD(P)-binding protein [candidate division KSB1 bacterium]|nr:FAD/NAD(P)-binding protein [candidate division KSB1 bacterium]MDZ7300512.1 FAD/NAD(P)-binding protein [candidate division KSB1 bacterium]MDZ7309651.1 FAD/NAD(P)-binding protein [candidate division KSB1 bacterium]
MATTTLAKQKTSEPVTTLIDPMRPAPFLVQRLRQDTHDTFTIEIKPDHGTNGFSFRAGQFNMLYLFGMGEAPISISGDPTKPKILVHTIRAVGTLTKAMRKLKEGDMLGVRGPFGTHWPVEEAAGNDVVIVAGGIGLAPLRPALYSVLAQRQKYGKVVLLYGTRTPADILYRRELEQWRSRLDLEVEVTVDRATPEWRGNVGVVTTLIPKAPFDPHNTVAMVCGPEIMMRFTVLELQKRGVPIEDIYLSMERNMKCAIGFCGHCQFGPTFICKDGPVFRYDRIKELFAKREI